MDKEIVSFIESIEPDFSYQGSDGVLCAVMETTDNMLAIDKYISSIEELEPANESVSEKLAEMKKNAEEKIADAKEKAGGFKADAAGRFKKAWDAIVEAVKRAIAKIKSLFMTQLKKVQLLYAQALEKVSAEMTKLGSNEEKTVDYEFDYLNPATFANYVKAYNPKEVGNAADLAAKVRNGEFSNLEDESVDKVIADALAGSAKPLTAAEVSKLTETLKEKCFLKATKVNIGKAGLKNYFNDAITAPIKELYKNILKSEEQLLRVINAFKNNRKDIVDGSVVRWMNAYASNLQSANLKFFGSVVSVSVTGLHKYIAAIIAAIRKNAVAKAKAVPGKVKDAAEDAANAAADKAAVARVIATGAKNTAAEKVKGLFKKPAEPPVAK